MKQEILIGQTDYTVLVKIRDDAGAPATGLTEASIDIAYARVETDNDVTTTDVTPAALTALTDAHTDWGFEEVSATDHPGLYRLDIADAVFASGAWSAVVTITGTGLDPCDLEFVLVVFDPKATALPANSINAAAIATGAIDADAIADNAIDAGALAADCITATKIAAGAIDAATFAADVDAEILSYLVDDATRIDASALNTATGTSIPAILTGTRAIASGTIGATGNDTTNLHLAGLTFGDDEINDLLIRIFDVSTSEYHSRWIDNWALTGELATVATLSFTPEASVDTYAILAIRRDVDAARFSGSATAADNAEVVFATDFASNYNATADRWKADITHSNGTAIQDSDFTIASATASTVTLPSLYTDGVTSLPDDDRYIYHEISVVGGTGVGQTVVLTTAGASARQYNVLSGTMPVQLDNTSECVVLGSIQSYVVDLIAAAANKIADHSRRRTQANVEASSDGDAVSLGSEYGMIQQMQESNLVDNAGFQTVYKTDGTTELAQKAVTTDAGAEPITGIS